MDPSRAWNLVARKLAGWVRDFILLLPNLALAVVILVAFWAGARLVRNLLLRLLRRISHSDEVNRFVAQAVYIAILGGGVFVSLGILGLQKTVASLLAGAGILGIALGFAFQDIAANFMAGIYMSVQRPFRPGDLIKTKDFFGVVQEINLRWTEILTPQGQLVLLPNKEVFENPLMNYSIRGTRRVDLSVGVSYGDDLEKARRVAIEAVEAIASRVPDRDVELFYEEFGDSSINFTLRFWIPFRNQADYLAARSEAIERLRTAFDANGITIPFPTRSIDFNVKGGRTLDEVLEEAVIARVEVGEPSRR